MLRSQRLTTILDRVTTNGSITVEEIISTLGVSPATARRDLDALAERGMLYRTRGGARASVLAFDTPCQQQRTHHLAEKNAISAACLTLLTPGCVIGLSGGSTVGALASALPGWVQRHHDAGGYSPYLTVVTNAVDIAYSLGTNQQIKIVLIGGVLNSRSFELTGPLGMSNLENFSLDIAFLGANGIDDNGPGTVDEFEAATNATMSARAKDTYVIADATKFGRRSFSSLGSPDTVTAIITDDRVSPEWVQRLDVAGYRVDAVPTRRENAPAHGSGPQHRSS